MPDFIFKALNRKGKEVQGTVTAPDAEVARADLIARGYQVQSLATKLRDRFSLSQYFKKQSKMELALFSRQIAVMFKSGVGIRRAFQVMALQGFDQHFNEVIKAVENDVSAGVALSKAMARHPKTFSSLYCGMIKAGETSGSLDAVLHRLADHMEKEVTLRRKITAAMTYPAFIFVFSMALALLVVQHILPTFINGVFAAEGLQLPLMTQILVVVTNFLNDGRIMGTLAMGLVVTCLLLWNYLKTPQGKYQLQLALHSLPGLREVPRIVVSTRFCRVFSALLKSGIPVSRALDITDVAIDDYYVSEQLAVAKHDISGGTEVWFAIKAMDVFSPVLVEFLSIGEETGRIPDLLDRLADMYDEDLDNAVVAYTSLIEPIMLGVMGLLVGYVVVAVFLPLYQLVETI